MIYCRIGDESCGPITRLTSSKQKKRAEFAVEVCEIVAAGNKNDCTNEERITLFTKLNLWSIMIELYIFYLYFNLLN